MYLFNFSQSRYNDMAKKIIESVENNFRLHELIKKDRNKYNYLEYFVGFKNRDELIKKLSTSLSKKLPDILHKQYENLNKDDQQIIRDKIAYFYYNLAIQSINDLQGSISFSKTLNPSLGYDGIAEITLPAIFRDDDYLTKILSNCIGDVIHGFHEKKDAVEFKNRL